MVNEKDIKVGSFVQFPISWLCTFLALETLMILAEDVVGLTFSLPGGTSFTTHRW